MFSPSKLRLGSNYLTNRILKASICHKSELKPQKQTSFPYKRLEWNLFFSLMDPFTKNKMNENSKIISVEGNVGCGKEDFGRRLADELGMLYTPMIDLESYYINDYGFDYRALNPLLPERLRLCDWEMFHENPSRHSVVHMLYFIFKLRLHEYLGALRHLLNTGQGVVMERSVFTDRVFAEAMHQLGWLPMGYLRADGVRFYDYKIRYDYIRNLALAEIPKPHLTLYLDTPVETCIERLRKSENPMIAQSKALIPEFLEQIEQAYLNVALPKAEHYSHVMKVDNPERKSRDEIMDVIYDIRDLDFEHDHRDTRFDQWEELGKLFWPIMRRRFSTMECAKNFSHLHQPYADIAGMGDSISHIDLKLRQSLYEANVTPVGYKRSYETDYRFQNPLKVIFDYAPFDEQLRRLVRSDFS